MSLVPAEVNLTETNAILQGSTYTRTFAVTDNGSPVNLSAYTAGGRVPRVQFRQTEADSNVILSSATSGQAANTIATAWISGGTTGQFTIRIEAVNTAALAILAGVYDVEIYDATTVERVMYGAWAVTVEVTTNPT